MKYIIAPTQQDVIGYKKVYSHGKMAIATLWIPKGTLVGAYDQPDRWPTSRKLRAEKALILRIELCFPKDHELKLIDSAYSWRDSRFIYRTLQEAVPTRPFSRRRDECESGIHFFLTRKEAEEY